MCISACSSSIGLWTTSTIPILQSVTGPHRQNDRDDRPCREDHFHISDTPHSGRPSGFDEDRLNTMIYNDPRQCIRELANVMSCDHSTIVGHLHSIGKVQISGVWVPHALSQNHKNQQLAICASLLARHRLAREQHRPFLSCIVTGDEKWCLYANIRKRKEWLILNKRRICCKYSNITPLGTPFSSVHGSTHYSKKTKL